MAHGQDGEGPGGLELRGRLSNQPAGLSLTSSSTSQSRTLSCFPSHLESHLVFYALFSILHARASEVSSPTVCMVLLAGDAEAEVYTVGKQGDLAAR